MCAPTQPSHPTTLITIPLSLCLCLCVQGPQCVSTPNRQALIPRAYYTYFTATTNTITNTTNTNTNTNTNNNSHNQNPGHGKLAS